MVSRLLIGPAAAPPSAAESGAISGTSLLLLPLALPSSVDVFARSSSTDPTCDPTGEQQYP